MIFFVIAILFMLLQGFFSGIETGLVSILKPRLEHALGKNVKGAHILAFFINSPGRMLGTTLIGTNLCIAVASNFAKEGIERIGFLGETSLLILSLIMACCFLMLEIIAKDWFRQQPYQRCLVFAYMLYASYIVLWFPVKLMSAFTAFLNKLAGKKSEDDDASRNLIREDFTLFIRDSERDGTIDSQAADMLDRSLEFSKLKARDIMQSKSNVKEIDVSWTIAQAVGFSRRCGKSRLPVCGTRDGEQWKGVFSVYDAIFSIP
ncbi:MAG: CNNM domain-containing protein, partial [Candidatus Nanoarchaeia archaeon]